MIIENKLLVFKKTLTRFVKVLDVIWKILLDYEPDSMGLVLNLVKRELLLPPAD